MLRKTVLAINLTLIICLLSLSNQVIAFTIDTAITNNLKPYKWHPISDVDKILVHENMKKLSNLMNVIIVL